VRMTMRYRWDSSSELTLKGPTPRSFQIDLPSSFTNSYNRPLDSPSVFSPSSPVVCVSSLDNFTVLDWGEDPAPIPVTGSFGICMSRPQTKGKLDVSSLVLSTSALDNVPRGASNLKGDDEFSVVLTPALGLRDGVKENVAGCKGLSKDGHAVSFFSVVVPKEGHTIGSIAAGDTLFSVVVPKAGHTIGSVVVGVSFLSDVFTNENPPVFTEKLSWVPPNENVGQFGSVFEVGDGNEKVGHF